MINRHDMIEIGAVADLRNYLNGQETVRASVETLDPLNVNRCRRYATS